MFCSVVKWSFTDCSGQRSNQQTEDLSSARPSLPITTTYESLDSSVNRSVVPDAVYTRIRTPQPDYENVNVAVPVYSN